MCFIHIFTLVQKKKHTFPYLSSKKNVIFALKPQKYESFHLLSLDVKVSSTKLCDKNHLDPENFKQDTLDLIHSAQKRSSKFVFIEVSNLVDRETLINLSSQLLDDKPVNGTFLEHYNKLKKSLEELCFVASQDPSLSLVIKAEESDM